VPIVNSQFSPNRILRNPHLQTVLASKVFKPNHVDTQRERIELPDGDFIDVNFTHDSSNHIVAMFHGLAGCVESPYVQGALASLSQLGFQSVLMHWRGCSGEPNRLARAYHSGASDDIKWFLGYLQQRFPDKKIYGLGYSLGGNALLKYLGEEGHSSALVGAMAVSPPLVLSEGANKLSTGFARVYQRYLLGLMREQHERKRLRYPDLNLPEAGPELNTFWKFDDVLTGPLHGFDGVHDYYKRCSARPFLSEIQTPTHIVSAIDDPFFTPAILPAKEELSKTVTLEIAKYGGHVGFLNKGYRWLDAHVANTMNAMRVRQQ